MAEVQRLNFKGMPAALGELVRESVPEPQSWSSFKGEPAALTEFVRKSVPDLLRLIEKCA
jgi:hypothetical protein